MILVTIRTVYGNILVFNFFFLDLMLSILSNFAFWTYHCMVTRYSWSGTYCAISEWACNFFFLDLMLTILSSFVVWTYHCMVTRYSWSRTYWAISDWARNFFFLDLMLTILGNFVVRANHCIPYTLSISPSSFCFVLTVFGLLVCFFL